MSSVMPAGAPNEVRGCALVLVLSLSKDGPHTPMPWFDKLTTGWRTLVGST